MADALDEQAFSAEPPQDETSEEANDWVGALLAGIAILAIPVVVILVIIAAQSQSRDLPGITYPTFVGVALAIGAAAVVVSAFVRDRVLAIATAFAGALAIAATNAGFYSPHYGDDAYITLRYSQNLSNGVGAVWNSGERVEGYTNFLWMVVLAGMHRIGADLVDASMWLSYAAMMLVFVAAWRIWSLWAEDAGGVLASPALLAVTLVTIAFNDSLIFWGFSGLETGLAAAMFTLTVALYLYERRRDGIPFSALAASAGAMTRPELILIAAVTGLFTLRDAAERRDEKSIARLVVWAALFGITWGAYFAWRWTYYGYFFPNTYYAKVGSSLVFIDRGMGYVHIFGSTYTFIGFAFGALALLIVAAAGIRRDAQYIMLCVIAWIAAVIVEGGDAFPHGRFIAPVVPVLYVAGIAGFALLLERAIPQRRQLAALGAAALLLVWLSLSRGSIDVTLANDNQARTDRQALGLWLRDNVPPDYTIAVYAAGAVPYYSELPAIDMLGLTDETIAHTDVPDFGEGIAGHEKYNIDYLLEERKPELIMYGDTAPFPLDAATLKTLRGPVAAGNALNEDERTFELYEPASVSYRGRWFNYLIRRDVLGTVPVGWTETDGFIPGGASIPPDISR